MKGWVNGFDLFITLFRDVPVRSHLFFTLFFLTLYFNIFPLCFTSFFLLLLTFLFLQFLNNISLLLSSPPLLYLPPPYFFWQLVSANVCLANLCMCKRVCVRAYSQRVQRLLGSLGGVWQSSPAEGPARPGSPSSPHSPALSVAPVG